MGNCMESCLYRKKENEVLEHKEEDVRESGDHQSGFVKEKCSRKGSLRVKIVLTKEELEWFMLQLQNKDGKSLEDVLEEIERGRGKVDQGWKPSLDSIMECPEVVEMDR
ncbi:hypothetical protein PanWU01x14_260440 [Parasponia andersonii]|uniref:Uncharacterized protein n=1 Tax=Parasponia andersonii TaxID=3476 RepID=A0A2P5B8V0_PARAD|nr:hypothetical protein PanWU01x14_260440 [Parasponia andersonii]